MRIAVVLERQLRLQDPPGQLDIGRSAGDRVGDQIPAPGSALQEVGERPDTALVSQHRRIVALSPYVGDRHFQ
ncbi:hypothetical protein ACFWMU_39090 [Streptomyces sp. NPDC058357]|uniref:hypothetical protein n=1 Tax=unclassified Streptomyces TaxID=2593676 RepID=UPI0036526E46